jgi:hypothetical protein
MLLLLFYKTLSFTMTEPQSTRTDTSASSTDSGQRTESLSDAYVAVAVSGRGFSRGSRQRVIAPKGSSHLLVRRSGRVAASRLGSVQPPAGELESKIGYVLPPVSEEPAVLTGNADGLRDIATPHLGPAIGNMALTGRKRSATSAAPSSGPRSHVSKRLASAADFSPTHFDEPVDDIPLPPAGPNLDPALPMKIDPSAGDHKRTSLRYSSPISQNPLTQEVEPMNTCTTPSKRHSSPIHTRDSDAAWKAAEGLIPISDTFNAPGFVPSQVVGGISYKILPSQMRHSDGRVSTLGKKLFSQYTDMQPQSNLYAGVQLDVEGVRFHAYY